MRPRNTDKEQAIRTIALDIIAREGLEHLSMQKLAREANVSPRTIYIKYENKEDFLVKLFIKEVLGAYELAVLEGFHESMSLHQGIQKIWLSAFQYLSENRPSFSLMRYGKSSPLLNRSFQQENITEGQFFAPIHRFLRAQVKAGAILDLPDEVHRALLFAPLMDLVSEYFDYRERPVQIITPEVVLQCCEAVIKSIQK